MGRRGGSRRWEGRQSKMGGESPVVLPLLHSLLSLLHRAIAQRRRRPRGRRIDPPPPRRAPAATRRRSHRCGQKPAAAERRGLLAACGAGLVATHITPLLCPHSSSSPAAPRMLVCAATNRACDLVRAPLLPPLSSRPCDTRPLSLPPPSPSLRTPRCCGASTSASPCRCPALRTASRC